jgi:hypothetical protein
MHETMVRVVHGFESRDVPIIAYSRHELARIVHTLRLRPILKAALDGLCSLENGRRASADVRIR